MGSCLREKRRFEGLKTKMSCKKYKCKPGKHALSTVEICCSNYVSELMAEEKKTDGQRRLLLGGAVGDSLEGVAKFKVSFRVTLAPEKRA